jgi:DNA-binding transcriptional LysR family regulator
MDVKTLYTLVAVADHGSFAAAGKAVGLSVSAVSVQMRALEGEIGQVLFDRSRRPPVLTDDGRAFVANARDVIARWEQLSDSLKQSAGGGVLKVGAPHTVVSGMLPAALLRLRKVAPDLAIRLSTGLTHDLEAAVRAGTLDAAIVTEPYSVPPGLTFEAFCEERLVVIAHTSVKGDDWQAVLTQNPYVRFNRLARVAQQVDTRLAEFGITVTSQMEIDTLEGVISLVAKGLGVSIVPDRAGGIAFPRSIRTLPFGDPPATRRLGVLAATSNTRQQFTRQLFEALAAESNA